VTTKTLCLVAMLAPLASAIAAGLFGRAIGRTGAHRAAIAGVLVSFLASCAVFADVLAGNTFDGAIYTWLTSGGARFEIGFLVDRLSALMMVVVTFVSLMVHIYTIGYMAEDPGYQRFFAYLALFTFSMLMLVMANNFVQLFFGWEAVGLVSYLLIGFWYKRPSAIAANLKAFVVNRVGDFGFLLGIALVFAYFGTLHYRPVFDQAPALAAGGTLPVTLLCLLLFVGAMGKSAQFPLHVWLPDSMEGPTPISALIHAATMVTAGIFMVARMSPLFELSQTARAVVLAIGAITALAMGLVALTQYDIKRVIAYSTLSQLGYMTAALGASAYAAAIFHLVTHAFFKAVLFLAAGSVILALHHEQDMRRMGGLRRHMPLTYATMLIGALASAGIPPLAGFFSKDTILEMIRHSQTPGAAFAWWCLLVCVFVTAAYTFRMLFLAFHGESRHDPAHPPHESPAVVTLPLVALAIPSVASGWWLGPVVFGDYFGPSIVVRPEHGHVAQLAAQYPGLAGFVAHGLAGPAFWLGAAGIATAYVLYRWRPDLPKRIARRLGILYALVERKYGFDELYARVFAAGARAVGTGLWKGGDERAIDGVMIHGSARVVGWFAGVVRLVQSGLVYWYAFVMIFGLATVYAMVKYRVLAP
jgi:NADH-quinone oxidoreductase subunit L